MQLKPKKVNIDKPSVFFVLNNLIACGINKVAFMVNPKLKRTSIIF